MVNGQRYIHYRNYAIQLKNKHTVAQHEMFCRPGEYLAQIPAGRSGDGGVVRIDGIDCVPFGAAEMIRCGVALGAAAGEGPPVMCTTAGYIPYGIQLKRGGANLRAEFICGEPTRPHRSRRAAWSWVASW